MLGQCFAAAGACVCHQGAISTAKTSASSTGFLFTSASMEFLLLPSWLSPPSSSELLLSSSASDNPLGARWLAAATWEAAAAATLICCT